MLWLISSFCFVVIPPNLPCSLGFHCNWCYPRQHWGKNLDVPVIPRSRSTFNLSRTCSFFPACFFWMVPVSWGNAGGSAKVSQKVYLTNFEQPRFCVRIDMNGRLCSTHLSANVDFPWSLKSAVSGWRVMEMVTTLPIWAIIEKFLKGNKKVSEIHKYTCRFHTVSHRKETLPFVSVLTRPSATMN